jgi:hypothetical protein
MRKEAGFVSRSLVLFVSSVLIGVLLISPTYFIYHTIPVWTVMAVLAGVAIGDVWTRFRASSPAVVLYLGLGLLASAVLSAASAWHTNGGRGNIGQGGADAPAVDGRGRFGYVLGTWPDFYVYNSLVPASDVMFPWALPGTPASWVYNAPAPDSLRGRMLTLVHSRSHPKLFDDFKRTPPSYILVLDDMARDPGSIRVTDVPGFDEYLQQRCIFMKTSHDARRGAAKLFRCNAGVGGAGSLAAH